MDDLDQIPWKELTHAYGTAEDVPDLLRQLSSTTPDGDFQDSPLGCLYGNIWHQGTVYEATPHAVPFLLRLAADTKTPDRVGILNLLALIASGSSYRDVHGDFLQDANFETQRKRELTWVAESHAAVAAGFDALVSMTSESSETRLAAAYVLAQLHERAGEVGSLFRELLGRESCNSHRAGWFLLLGQVGDRSEQTVAVLSEAVQKADPLTRLAAAYAIAQLKLQPLPPGTREVVIDAIKTEAIEESFDGLPWDVSGDIDRSVLRACLTPSDREQIADQLIEAIESDNYTDDSVAELIELLFPFVEFSSTPALTASDLSPRQQSAVRAMLEKMEGGKRIFYGCFSQWRLPDTMREWRNLAAGRQPTPIDMMLPLIAAPDNPRLRLRPDQLSSGDRIVHRHFGLGTVNEVHIGKDHTGLKVLFDEEGLKTLSVPSDGSNIA